MLKKIGLIILTAGILITLITGFNYVTKENVAEIDYQQTAEYQQVAMDNSDTASWSPLLGITVIFVGGVIFIAGEEL